MKIVYFLIACLLSFSVRAQDSLVTKIASQHYQIINFENKQFSGDAIINLTQKIAQYNYVLIGEDHLNNEVLDFTTYLTQNINFDNYITEADQLTINILKKDFQKDKTYQSIISHSNDRLSLFSFNRDRDLLNYFFQNKKTVIGLDQIYFNSDMVILQELIKRTTNKEALLKYKAMLKESNARWSKYKANPDEESLPDGSNIPYLFSYDFSQSLADIQKLNLSEYEQYALSKLLKSNMIYGLGTVGKGVESHYMRISLMKENLLENLNKIKGKRNLFKLGANHVGRDKSLFQNSFDVGNMVANIADAEHEKSLHIAIIQKQGKAGSFTSDSIDADYVSFLKPFYQLVSKEKEWLLFDTAKINEEIKKQKTIVESNELKNLLGDYDYLIIIPKVTAQKIVV